MEKFDIKSDKAASFINQQEIIRILSYAKEHCQERNLALEILKKAEQMQGLSAEETAVLLLNQDEQLINQIFTLAAKIKNAYYGNRVVLFAPLYLSNYCVNGCTYCPYHASNHNIPRLKMSQEQIKTEVMALQDMGHKRLALEAGEHPLYNPLSYILESIETIYSIHHRSGSIRRVNVNIAATTVENYKLLHAAKIGTYILFQETYNQKQYEKLHLHGPKANYAYHTEAMDRAMSAGIEDVGLGVLFGLHNYAYELVALLLHAKHLEIKFGAGPHTISVPRLRPADGINVQNFPDALPDNLFLKIVALLRIAVPYTGIIMSTRETETIRKQSLQLGVSQISGGSKTSVGGYTTTDEQTEESAQFETADNRSLDEIVGWLMQLGYIPSFCTACYGKGRQGIDFMKICKDQQIHNFCAPNALLTLEEYLQNYASSKTRYIGSMLFNAEISKLPEMQKKILFSRIKDAKKGSVKFF